jgi:hypothetical protein
VGLLWYLTITVVPTVPIWAAARWLPAAVAAVDARGRRNLAPSGPSLQSLVADLRRLRREMCGAAPRSRLRRVALFAAYDDVLIDLCPVIGIEAPPLATAAEGADRAFARLQTEAAVEAAGITLDQPPGEGRAAA